MIIRREPEKEARKEINKLLEDSGLTILKANSSIPKKGNYLLRR